MTITELKIISDNVAGLVDEQVIQRTMTVDTLENVVVSTAGLGKRIYLIGWDFVVATGSTVTWKSGTAKIAEYILAANQGSKGEKRMCLMTELNEALSFQSTVAGTLTIKYTTSQRVAYDLRIV